jgi:hypothetical protein
MSEKRALFPPSLFMGFNEKRYGNTYHPSNGLTSMAIFTGMAAIPACHIPKSGWQGL